MFVLILGPISGKRLQDHWSSGFFVVVFFFFFQIRYASIAKGYCCWVLIIFVLSVKKN